MGENRRVPTTSAQDQVTSMSDGHEPEAGAVARPGAGPEPGVAPDAVCAAAVGVALTGLRAVTGPATIGAHLGVSAEGERLATHYFACTARGYRGWRWAVTVARTPRARTATVCESVLLPGAESVLPPAWVPWSERLAPGDLGASDVLPYRVDDPFLEPGFEQTDEDEADRLALWELGLGRVRVLSRTGRDAAATRWYAGSRGPTADEAVHAAAACASCGYFVPLAGAWRREFGVCANEWSGSDGQVVSVDHGCGAHSETDVEKVDPYPLPEPILDELGAEAVVIPRATAAVETAAAQATDDGGPEAGEPEREAGEPEREAGGAEAEPAR